MTIKDNLKALSEKVNKTLKYKAIQTFSEEDDNTIQRLSTGIIPLDLILGKGSNGYGFPIGRMSEIMGPESSGKTTAVLQMIGHNQKLGKTCALVDAEHVYDPEIAQKAFGVDIDNLLICQPDNAEEAFDVITLLAESGEIDLIILDSIAAMGSKKEFEGTMEDKSMGGTASVNAQFCRKITPILNQKNVTLIIVNQIREKIGSYHPVEYSPGGRQLRHTHSVRVEIRRKEDVEVAGNKIGHVVKFKTIKNKTASPQQIAEARIIWGKGWDAEYDLANIAILNNVIKKSGAWFSFKEDKFHGMEALIDKLRNDKEFYNEIESMVKNNV